MILMIFRIAFWILILSALTNGQFRREDNTCPYLKLPGKQQPILCWMCGSTEKNIPGAKLEYDCCPGYKRDEILNNKCGRVERSWQNIIDYLRGRDDLDSAQALERNSGVPDLGKDDAPKHHTVFVPKNDEDVKTGEINYVQVPNSAGMMVSPGRWYSKDFRNGQRIPTTKGEDIKVSTYSNGLIFLECKLLYSPDHETANGLIQYVDGAIPPTYQAPTILKRLVSEPDLSSFTNALPSDLRQELDRPKSSTLFTVFAPTNNAFDQVISKIPAGEARNAFVRQHVMKRMICADAVLQNSNKIGPTMADTYVGMKRNPDGSHSVIDECQREIPISRKDLMTGTGVIHVVSSSIQPMKSMDLNAALDCLANNPKSKASRAAKEMKDCNLKTGSGHNSIVLVPTDDAFNRPDNSEGANRMRSNSQYRCNVYAYHILQSKQPQYSDPGKSGFVQEQEFPTQYSGPGGTKPTVIGRYVKERDGTKIMFNQAATTKKKPFEYRDGIVYPIDQINFPPEKTMMDLIREEPETSDIINKMQSSGFTSDLRKHSPNVLFLATIDKGWKTRDVEAAYTDSQTRKLLQLHTIPHALFGGSNGFVWRDTIQEVDSALPGRDGKNVKLRIKRYKDGNTFIGHKDLPEDLWSMVLKWNKLGTDGMVWIIDWPMRCPDGLC